MLPQDVKLPTMTIRRRPVPITTLPACLPACLLACLLTITLVPPAHAELPDPTRFSVVLELGDVAQAERWLDEGLDPNFEGHLIGTGLMIGAWEGNIPLLELFLARGADIHRSNRFGETALMLAAWKNRAAALQWLLDHGAKPNRPGKEEKEWSALHYATFAGHAPLVDTLLAAGADINARSTNGSTVIMMAAREGHAALAQRLLEAGANPALKNDFDDDAVAWAMRQQNFAIAKSFTSAENFAELSRLAATQRQPALRSLPAPDAVDDFLRMARLAEVRGQRGQALAAYRKALATLKAQEKVATGKTASKPREVKGLVIRARRDAPEQQALSVTRAEQPAAGVDQLLEQARKAELAGNRAEALRLFRAASTQLKTPPPGKY